MELACYVGFFVHTYLHSSVVVLLSRCVLPFRMMDKFLALRPGRMLWMQQAKADQHETDMIVFLFFCPACPLGDDGKRCLLHRIITELQNILSWKEPARIIVSSP